MAPSKARKASKANTSSKKEKIFHPQSRKADQLSRKALRKEKLESVLSNRNKKHDILADFYGFFYHALPAQGTLTLEELHNLIVDVWFKRYDEDLEVERAARRKGRPKSTKESKLEELKLRESEEYRTGFEVIDLTHPQNVALFRTWDQKEVAFIDLLRFIRICSTSPTIVVVSRPGKHVTLAEDKLGVTEGDMDLDT
ncbi:hypothetical protein GYMLUDRAFT_43724 [Collybiopsis luxurians FD-317 M1]|uniref:Translation machinery-associated protein 16 n=1 Tax=Collybiopsis luxurians FD-317 M1 TaxID=944289 RepID=A0A0D0B9Q9_9AGAR|nr:hypothetical protein GYMLUDRAFT_43724 [Collybiopsis luxurians FD-317 M1]